MIPDEPVLVVTGGSRGIGAATARLAAQRGFHVAFTYRENRVAADAVVRAIEHEGREALAAPADVATESDILHLFEAIDARFGRVDALVNNAGILDRQMRVADMTAERIRRTLDVNVVGAFLCAR